MRLFTRSEGAGPTVLCLHSSAGSGQQWQPLAEALAPRYRVICVDTHGHGRSAAPAADPAVMEQDAACLAPLIGAADGGVHLVGHSYGGALAVRLALSHPARVRSLALFEPVLFSMVADPSFPAAAREEIGQIGRTICGWMEMGRPLHAARLFMDYWAGTRGWSALGGRQQRAIAARMPVVARHFGSLFDAGITLRHVARLAVPTLLMSGARSRRTALAIADALAAAWPHADVLRLPGLGHLAPMTHAAEVNAPIARHLDSAAQARRGRTATPARFAPPAAG